VGVKEALSIREKGKGSRGQKSNDDIVEDRHAALGIERKEAASIFVERNITNIMKLVFNRPMYPKER